MKDMFQKFGQNILSFPYKHTNINVKKISPKTDTIIKSLFQQNKHVAQSSNYWCMVTQCYIQKQQSVPGISHNLNLAIILTRVKEENI